MARRKDLKKGDPPERGSAKAAQRRAPRAFDIWLDRSLHTLYDSVTKEPVPEELLRVIEENRKK